MAEFLTDQSRLKTSKAVKDRIDAFKALTPYYVWQMKNKGREEPEDDLPTFDNFQKNIHAP